MKNNTFTHHLGIQYPVIGGAMYPCSNPELVAAISQAGGIGIVQPVSLTYVHGYDFRQGLHYIKTLTNKPIGMNVLIETNSSKYHTKMQQWINIALEEGIRFFTTSLGKPDWVVQQVQPEGGLVYHAATEKKWAEIGANCGVDGLICVNNRAGGHAGHLSSAQLAQDLKHLNLPLVAAGGIAQAQEFKHTLNQGYVAAQLGTRFIASKECSANNTYKQAIINATEQDIILSKHLTGVPVSIINTAHSDNTTSTKNKLINYLSNNKITRKWMRTTLSLTSLWHLKQALKDGKQQEKYWQAGKSVTHIKQILSCEEIIQEITNNKPY